MNFRKIIGFSIGPIGGAIIGLITVPVITWYFSPDDIGKIALVQVTSSFLILFFSLGLDQAYVREYHEHPNKPALLKMSLLPGLLILVVVSILLIVDSNLVSRILFDINSTFLSVLVIIWFLAAFISRFLSLILRMQEKGIAYSISQLLPKFLFFTTIILCIGLSYNLDIYGLIIAHAFSVISATLIYAWNTREEWLLGLRQKVDVSKLKSMLHFGIPLILSGVAYWGLTATDKLLLRSLSSFEELGVYAVATSFAGVALIFQSIFSVVWAPTIYKWVANNKNLDKVEEISDYILIIALQMLSLIGIFSWVITYLLPDAYYKIQYLLVICMIPPVFYTISETTVIGISVTKKSSYAMIATIMAAVINLIGNYFLIPNMGSTGAAISTAIAFWFLLVLRTEFSSRIWRPIRRKKIYILTSVFLVFIITFQIYGSYYYIYYISLWLVFLFTSLLIYTDTIKKSYYNMNRATR